MCESFYMRCLPDMVHTSLLAHSTNVCAYESTFSLSVRVQMKYLWWGRGHSLGFDEENFFRHLFPLTENTVRLLANGA